MFVLGRICFHQGRPVFRIQCTSLFIIRGAKLLPRIEETEQYFIENLQVPRKSAIVLSRICTISDIEERVTYFKQLGLTKNAIELVFKKASRSIMACRVSEMDERVKFLSQYTTLFRDSNVLISHLIPQYPRLLYWPIEMMENRIKLLEKCYLSEEEIARIIRYNPVAILTRLEHAFEELVEYLKDCGLSDQIIHKLFTKEPRFVTFRWEAIDKRVRFFMEELDYTRERIIEVFTNNANVLLCNVERMRERSNFIKNDMGLSNHALIKTPLVLRYSLERIQWRYYFLCKVGYEITDETYLLRILYYGDEMFGRYVAKRPLDEVITFKENFYENLNSPSYDSSVVSNTAAL